MNADIPLYTDPCTHGYDGRHRIVGRETECADCGADVRPLLEAQAREEAGE